MADIDPQLVAQITKAVIDALQQDGNSASHPPASIKPPIGVCTGDYAQFTDRPDLKLDAERSEAPDPPPAALPDPPPLTGIITAQQLHDAIAHAPDGVAVIAHDARPTPLANDFIRENPDQVHRVVPTNARHATAALGQPWLWWADGHCPAVVATTTGLGGKVVPSGAARSEAGLTQVIHDLAHGVRQRSVLGGLLFVRSAARAIVLANRCPHLRAVVGSCPEAVEQGIAQVGANVLIVEYPYVNAERLAAMVTRMTQSKPVVSAHVERELADLHRNG